MPFAISPREHSVVVSNAMTHLCYIAHMHSTDGICAPTGHTNDVSEIAVFGRDPLPRDTSAVATLIFPVRGVMNAAGITREPERVLGDRRVTTPAVQRQPSVKQRKMTATTDRSVARVTSPPLLATPLPALYVRDSRELMAQPRTPDDYRPACGHTVRKAPVNPTPGAAAGLGVLARQKARTADQAA
jgi:hypothetical protein